ncbi:MAG: ABC-2 transporter permease [Oscillospiraceae bacterium]
MRGLLYKNYLLYRADLIVIGCFMLIGSATLLINAALVSSENIAVMQTMIISFVMCFAIFLLTNMLEAQLFAPDEKHAVKNFIISAPCGAKGHIESKYYTILIVDMLVLVCCFLTDAAVCVIRGTTECSVCMACMFFFCGNLMLSAFSNPFYVRLGTTYGNSARFGAFGVLVFGVVIYGLFGDISFLFVDYPMAAIIQFITSGNTVLVLSLFPAASVLLYYASYRLSLKLYRKGAESYEQ